MSWSVTPVPRRDTEVTAWSKLHRQHANNNPRTLHRSLADAWQPTRYQSLVLLEFRGVVLYCPLAGERHSDAAE